MYYYNLQCVLCIVNAGCSRYLPSDALTVGVKLAQPFDCPNQRDVRNFLIRNMHLSQTGFSLSFIFLAFASKSLGQQQMKETTTQFLMVVGGVYRAGFPTSGDVDLLSLDSDVEVPECLQNLHDHPRRLHWSCPAILTPGMMRRLLLFLKQFYRTAVFQPLYT